MYRECMTVSEPMHKVTVNLIPKAWAAAEGTAERLRLTRTDVINRALQAYAYLEEQAAAGSEVLVRHPDGTVRQVMFL
jgi:hypothetical protein